MTIKRGRRRTPYQGNPALARRLRVALYERGVTQKQIAEEAGVTKQAVSAVIHGKATSRPITNLICKIMGWQRWPGSPE